MFDIGITEIGVIAVVALIVIGPERLPRVARTVGTLLGRAQRYVNDVKAEVNREIELDELKKLQTQMKEAADSVQQQMTSVGSEVQSAVQDVEKSFQSGIDAVGGEVSSSVKAIEQSVAGSDTGAGGGVASEPSPAGPAGSAPALTSASGEPSAAGPWSPSPYTPLEEPPIPPEDAVATSGAPSAISPASPTSPVSSTSPGMLRDPRAAANVAVARNVEPAAAAADDSPARAGDTPGSPPAVRRPRLRDPRAAANVAVASDVADRGEPPLQSSLFR